MAQMLITAICQRLCSQREQASTEAVLLDSAARRAAAFESLYSVPFELVLTFVSNRPPLQVPRP
eukprot:2537868-Prymnesium_polylepis.1